MSNFYQETKELLEKIEENTRDLGEGGSGGETGNGLTNTELRAAPLDVVGPITNAQIRASAISVTGPVTDAQIRANPIPVTGGLTNTELRASAVPVSGPATNTELRATPLPVSGTIGVSGTVSTTVTNTVSINGSVGITGTPSVNITGTPSINISNAPTVNVSTSNLTPTLQTVTTGGTVATGAQSVAFYNLGPDIVTIGDASLGAKLGINFDAGINRLNAITYSVPSGTSLQIAQIR